MKGLLWEFVPGKHGMHIFVDVDDNGEDLGGDHGREIRPTEILDDEIPMETHGGIDKLHISRKAITKYGATIGCPGCNELARRGQQSGKINYHGFEECRKRIIEHMKEDPEYRKLLEKHGFTLGMIQSEILTETHLREQKNQVQDAMNEIERKEKQCQRGSKEGQLNQMMRKFMLEQVEVVEAHSPPRIVEMVMQMGLTRRVEPGSDDL